MKYVAVTRLVPPLLLLLLGPIPMMIGAELFRQAPRPLAMAVAGVVNWVTTFVIAMGFESIQVCHLCTISNESTRQVYCKRASETG